MTTRLKTYAQIKANPELAILKHLEMADAMADKMARKAVAEILESISQEFREKVNELSKQLEDSLPVISQQLIDYLRDYTLTHPEKFKGVKGDTIKGDKGDTPSKKELLDIIKPLIPKDGKTPTREELLDLINPLIPQVKVKDFSPEIKEILEKFDELNKKIVNLRQNVRASKGGGMGNSIHKVFNLTASTTTCTLDYPIAGNGTAIFAARYQGQVQDLGIHYSVGSGDKIITLLFTPEDGTKWSISYIRG